MDETGVTGDLEAPLLRRLRRIQQLRVSSPRAVLGELRLLVPEAEAWARAVLPPPAPWQQPKVAEEVEGMR